MEVKEGVEVVEEVMGETEMHVQVVVLQVQHLQLEQLGIMEVVLMVVSILLLEEEVMVVKEDFLMEEMVV
jgi:hypothetical protein